MEGSHTLLSDRLGRFTHVKPVAWPRSRAGDDQYWAKKDYDTPMTVNDPSSRPTPHPSLIEFQKEQSRILQRQAASKAAAVESPTTSSIYGQHTLTSTHSNVNDIGAEQILEQQEKLWAPLSATSKRLGFGISQAKEGSEFREIERAQDRKRFMSVAALSYSNPTANRVEIAKPESMNRTTSLFPLQPVNQFAAPVLASRQQPIIVTSPKKTNAGEDNNATSPSSSIPYEQTLDGQRTLAAAGNDISTAHSLGYGKRHTFFRHYLTSVPDFP